MNRSSNLGTLTRANEIISLDNQSHRANTSRRFHNPQHNPNHYWLRQRRYSGRRHQFKRGVSLTNDQLRARNSSSGRNILLIKMQETAINFLCRWVIIDKHQINQPRNIKRKNSVPSSHRHQKRTRAISLSNSTSSTSSSLAGVSKSKRNSTNSTSSTSEISGDTTTSRGWTRRRSHQQSGIRSLLSDLNSLQDQSYTSLARFIFWRWLTPANVLELLLALFLFACCSYQCKLFLDDYYQYPAQITVKKILNDDFRTDLPSVTLCDHNVISKETLALLHPELNETHYMAITLGTFYSINNFTLNPKDMLEAELVARRLDTIRRTYEANRQADSYGLDNLLQALDKRGMNVPSSKTNHNKNNNNINRNTASELGMQIDWIKVADFLNNNTIDGRRYHLPRSDLIEQVNCANIWGDNLPCKKLRRIESIQNGQYCVTLFHDSIFWDVRQQGVSELNEYLAKYESHSKVSQGPIGEDYNKPSDGDSKTSQPATSSATSLTSDSMDSRSLSTLVTTRSDTDEGILFQLNQDQLTLLDETIDSLEDVVEMGSMEILRIRLNFRKDDYVDKRMLPGASIAVHANNFIGLINHISYTIEPEKWYNFYIERLDYKRLRAPYKDNCYDYEENRYIWSDREKWREENLKQLWEIMHRQTKNPQKRDSKFSSNLRLFSMGSVSTLYDEFEYRL